MKTLFVKRNLIVSILAVMLLTYSIQGISYGQEVPDTIVEFKDINLAESVRWKLGLPTGDGVDILKIPKSELIRLTGLGADNRDINDLTGLEHATQLRILEIDDNNIRDITPLAQLTQLTVLNLAGNNIINLTPLAQLTQLTELYLYGNQIRDVTPLAQLTQLTSLSLSSNYINDITPLVELTQLTKLRLYRNQIRDVTPLAQLTQLTSLNLSSNYIINLTSLAQLTQLTELYLDGNQITDVTPLTSLVNLQVLRLKDNPIADTSPLGLLLDESPGLEIDIRVITGPVVEFADATLARKIRRELGLITGDGVEFLKIPKSELEKLTTLNNSFARDITDLTGLEHATQLRELDISLTRIRNVAPLDITPLAQLTQLISLTLEDNNIIDITPLAQLTQLTKLSLSDNNISDITPLAQLTKLTELSLGDNNIIDITPLTPLTQLTELYLYTNQIRDITPLAPLTQLTKLSLHENQIKDVTPLTPLTQLTELYLYTNQITDVTPLAQLTQLTKLSLRKNQIKDVTPLASLINLQDLWLKDNPIWSTYPLNALLDANPGLGLDVKVTDAVPFPMTEVTVNGNAELRVLSPELQGQPMFWVNTGTSKIESSEHFDVVTQGVTVLTVDRAGGKLYWGERSKNGGIIKRANFDGTNVEALVTLSSVPRGIVVDTVRNKMYWTNSDLQIQTATLDGGDISTVIQLEEDILEETKINCRSGGFFLLLIVPLILGGSCDTDIIRTNLTSPTDIALNTVDGRLYWTEFSGRIRRVNLDGTNVETLLSDIGSPYGITVVDDKVYWAEEIDENTGKIQRAKLNGTNVETLAKVQGLPTGISVDTAIGKVYWANSLGGIQRTDINGGEVEVVVSGITAPGDFVLVPDSQQTTPTTEGTTGATVSILPASVASPAIGQQIEFNLNITDSEAVAGYQATVQFDTTALRYVSSANGDFLPAGAFFVQPVVEGNLVKLNAASLAGEISGDGTLATLTFEVIAAKTSTLTLSDVLLTDSTGATFVPHIENAEITESTGLKEDVNGDGTVNIADLVLVAGALGETGQNAADVNGDGQVNIADLVLVAGALGTSAAAPSLDPQFLSTLTAADVKLWLSQAQQLNLTDAASLQGIQFLEQLLAALMPKKTALLANYPNPFNPETWIPYHLVKDADVKLHIYSMNGTLVRTLTLGHQAAGMYRSRSRAAYWDGKNEFGESVASGVYFYTLTAGDFSATRKMLIRK